MLAVAYTYRRWTPTKGDCLKVVFGRNLENVKQYNSQKTHFSLVDSESIVRGGGGVFKGLSDNVRD